MSSSEQSSLAPARSCRSRRSLLFVAGLALRPDGGVGSVLPPEGGPGDPGAARRSPGATSTPSPRPTTRTSTPRGCSRWARRCSTRAAAFRPSSSPRRWFCWRPSRAPIALCRRRGAGAGGERAGAGGGGLRGARAVRRAAAHLLARRRRGGAGRRSTRSPARAPRRRPRARRALVPGGRRPVGQPARGRVRRAGAARRRGAGRAGRSARPGRRRARLAPRRVAAPRWRRWPRRSASGLMRYLRLHLMLPALHPVDEFRAADLDLRRAAARLRGALVGAAAFVAGRRRPARRRAGSVPACWRWRCRWRRWRPSVRFGADFALVARAAAGRRRSTTPAPARGACSGGVAQLLRSPLPARGDGRAADRLRGRAAPAPPGPRLGIGLDTRELPLDGDRLRRTTTACASGCTTTSRSARTCCSNRGATRATGCSSIRACRPTRRRCTALLGRADLTRDEWDAAHGSLRRRQRAARLRGPQPPRRLVGPGALGAGLPRRTTRASSCAGCRAWRALIAAHEIPATFAFTVEEGTDDAAARAAPRRRRRSPDCEWQRRLGDLLFELDGALSERARAAYAARWRRRRLPGRAGRGAARRLAGRGRSGRAAGRPTRSRCSTCARRRKPRALHLHRSRCALEALGRRADAAAAWSDVAARAGDSPLALRARGRAARLRN